MERLTQKDRVLRHIQDYGSISSFEAFTQYGITRLSAVIYLLRHDDLLPIDSISETTKNRYGEPVSFFHYYLSGSKFEEQLKKEGKI